MRTLATLLGSLVAITATFSQEPRPNSLTPKEIADGWLLLFDGESTFGLKTEGDVKVADSMLILTGGDKGCRVTSTSQFGDAALAFDYLGEGVDKIRVHFITPATVLDRKPSEWLRAKYVVTTAGQERRLGASFYRPIASPKKVFRKDGVQLDADDSFVAAFSPQPVKLNERSAVSIEVPAGSKLQIKNLKLKPEGLQSIFNGKDLAGWKEHPGKKSKFAVVGGAINIKDGPGDLQTEGQWGDFVLQLECKSNGKHLNSGIFFRCIPGLYQQGYEAQVRNEFTPETREYIVEVFDAQTNQPLEKRKIQSPAVDFGTGAIYRRMPARKEVAKDGEWFTMTVIAHGRHMATWVNGVQQVDWTDNRPKNENARNGYREEKGPISLQGHDPTTDLSFRNFRIAELPK